MNDDERTYESDNTSKVNQIIKSSPLKYISAQDGSMELYRHTRHHAMVPKDSQNISLVLRTIFPLMTIFRVPYFLVCGATFC
jgi:hypothetical protein